MTATGARFELRVDDQPTSNGRARAVLKAAEVGSDGVPVSITGLFTNLATGAHTISLWVEGINGSGTGATYDPGCCAADHVVVEELN